MDDVARFSEQDRKDLFLETAKKLKIPVAIVEKDFWVCWVLNALFESEQWGSKMIFKGGTSLSKVYGVIKRFSEDIDLILDWRLLGYEDKSFWENRSNSKKNQFSDTVMETNNEYIKNTFIPSFKSEIEARLKISLSVEFSETPIPSVIINYPKAHETGYIKPQIQLEIGPIAEWVPNAKKSISSFATTISRVF